MSVKLCDYCNRPLPKGRKRFCSNKEKDRWHNINNPRGYGLLRVERHNPDEDVHPFSSLALGQD